MSSYPFPSLSRGQLTTLQVNLGYRCNQSCSHCHVDAGPWRTEMMSTEQIELIPQVIERLGLELLDLTGGAPELHPQFRSLVTAVRAMDVEVIDRCNLTILNEPGQEDLADFLASQRVHVVASLPCTEQDRVDRQRGRGVFARSIEGLGQLNALGYGMNGSDLCLDLVYNPGGPFLPPEQTQLEEHYRDVLLKNYGIHFSRLLTITNMPIKRFAQDLERQGALQTYQRLLRDAFRAENLSAVMCRSLISVDWQGRLFDCDFNQQLSIGSAGAARTLQDLMAWPQPGLNNEPIAVGEHCFGCTAGSGSSCSGALH